MRPIISRASNAAACSPGERARCLLHRASSCVCCTRSDNCMPAVKGATAAAPHGAGNYAADKVLAAFINGETRLR